MAIYLQKSKKGNTETIGEAFSSWEEAELYITEKILPSQEYRYYSFYIIPEKNIKNYISKIKEYLYIDKNDVHIYSYRLVERIQ
jgi:hypothetical protein